MSNRLLREIKHISEALCHDIYLRNIRIICIEFSHEIFNSDWDSVCVHLEPEKSRLLYNITHYVRWTHKGDI